MDVFDLKTLLLIIGAVVIIAVLWDLLKAFAINLLQKVQRQTSRQQAVASPQRQTATPTIGKAPYMPEAPKKKNTATVQLPKLGEILTISVVCKDNGEFDGAALLQVLLSNGLRFGEMSIFHRHESASGEGAILFSLADLIEPGTFDLDNMQSLYTTGVALFLTLPSLAKPMDTFELMLKTAQSLADELGGELRDSQHSSIQAQTIEHYREQISEYSRKSLAFKTEI